MDLEKGTFISNGLDSRSEEYYLGTTTWSTNPEDWELRIGAGGIVNDPQGEWDYSTAEAYINEQITIEANIRQAQDTRIEGLIPLADNEDLTKSGSYLKFKDRTYNQVSPNGMGRVILRNNLVEEVNTLTQSMISQTNTIYVIQYDFTLGENITIPSNCILDFEGGSINSGTITGNNTQMKAADIAIFTDIIIADTWNVPYITSAWFSDITQDNKVKNLIALTDENIYNEVTILEGTYVVSIAELNTAVLYPNSNTKINLLGTLQLTPNSIASQRIIALSSVENVTIIGTGSIIGDKNSHIGEGEGACEGIRIGYAKNITIQGIEISNWWTDGIYIGGSGSQSPVSRDNVTSDILIRGLKIHDCRRQGISVTKAQTLTIEQCEIYNISGTPPQAGIDIEPNTNNMAKEIYVHNNYIHDCAGACFDTYGSVNGNFYYIEDVLVENNTFYNPNGKSIQIGRHPKNVIYCNNRV